jgi:hypothetical protein
MLKGICTTLLTAVLFAVAHGAQAQIYRCEGPQGVEFSDMPCGESAEEVELEVLEPATGTGDMSAAVNGEDALPQETDTLAQFLQILHNQREVQINEIDRNIAILKSQAEGYSDESGDGSVLIELNAQIAEMETNRASVLEEYEALIAEAERRQQ